MGPLLVLVSPCFRKNVVVTCKSGSFLCSLDNIPQKKRNCLNISHSHTYMYFAHPIDIFCLTNFEKNTNLSGLVSLWYDSWCCFLFAPFWNNQWITDWWAKFKLQCLPLICIYTNAKFIVICKPRTLNDEVKTQLNTEIAKNTASQQ